MGRVRAPAAPAALASLAPDGGPLGAHCARRPLGFWLSDGLPTLWSDKASRAHKNIHSEHG
eukprot:SAG25_NODE_6_length_29267_cov_21.188803_34_plen_61_part_00